MTAVFAGSNPVGAVFYLDAYSKKLIFNKASLRHFILTHLLRPAIPKKGSKQLNNEEMLKRMLEKSPPSTECFMSKVKETLEELPYNIRYTENGAPGYETSGKFLLDLDFATPSLRKKPEKEIQDIFLKAYFENPIMATKWLFYLRDIRGGLGERRSFRILLKCLENIRPRFTERLIPLIPEYGRYDDLFELLDTELQPQVIRFVREQLIEDLENVQENKSISLLAKWLPSEKSKDEKKREQAKIIMFGLGITGRTYRKICSTLRGYMDIVETNMSSDRWNEVDYSKVPSKANLKYKEAFMKHDGDRRKSYLESLQRGDENVKINAGTMFPHEIVHSYQKSFGRVKNEDATLEELWKALPDEEISNTIVVADGSGSMYCTVDNGSSTKAIDVAIALAIYFSERLPGEYKDKYITFSNKPKYVDMSQCETLREKIKLAVNHCEVANTNIEAVFDLILDTAVRNRMSQEEIPKNILVISDMEFDACVRGSSGFMTRTLFGEISNRYQKNGYKLPRTVFWNVNSRTNTIPMKQNELGVALISGFSTSRAKMVMSEELDPYKCLIEQLNSERYKPVEDVYREVQKERKTMHKATDA